MRNILVIETVDWLGKILHHNVQTEKWPKVSMTTEAYIIYFLTIDSIANSYTVRRNNIPITLNKHSLCSLVVFSTARLQGVHEYKFKFVRSPGAL